MINFRIIETKDGKKVIRRDLKTPYSALTPLQYIEYTNMEVLLYIDYRHKKVCQKEAVDLCKLARNPFFRFACFCGLV